MTQTLFAPEWLMHGPDLTPVRGRVVAVENGKIMQVMLREEIAPVEAEAVVEFPGCTMMPGLINSHLHLTLPGNVPEPIDPSGESDVALALRAVTNAAICLRAGVTTVRDCGSRGMTVLELRRWETDGAPLMARILTSGPLLTVSGGHGRHLGRVVDGVSDCRREVRRLVHEGVDFVKVIGSGGGTPGTFWQYPSFTLEEMRAIVETSHQFGRRVTVHCTCRPAIDMAIDAGADSIEHGLFISSANEPAFDDDVAERLAKNGIAVIPTLQIYREAVDRAVNDASVREKQEYWRAHHRKSMKRLFEAGVRIVAGSDAGWRTVAFGTFHRELEELVACGLTERQALACATAVPGVVFGVDRVGVIAEGWTADFLIVEGDVDHDISALSNVHAVYSGGQRVLDRSSAR